MLKHACLLQAYAEVRSIFEIRVYKLGYLKQALQRRFLRQRDSMVGGEGSRTYIYTALIC